MKSVTLSFNNTTERDQFMKSLNDLAKHDTPHAKLVTRVLKTAKFDAELKPDSERVCSLWVSGQKLVEGPLAEIQNKFKMECDAHSASVAIREMKNGTWVDIMKRNVQPR